MLYANTQRIMLAYRSRPLHFADTFYKYPKISICRFSKYGLKKKQKNLQFPIVESGLKTK